MCAVCYINYCINEWLQLDEEEYMERIYGADETHQLGYTPSDIVSRPHWTARDFYWMEGLSCM
jgi:hypothetical protein